MIVANEVLDALPVERFVVRGGAGPRAGCGRRPRTGSEWVEARAGVAAVRPRSTESRRDCGVDWPEGYASEVNLGLGPWLAAVADAVERGVMLFVDYGLPRRDYYAAERTCRHAALPFPPPFPRRPASRDRGCRTSPRGSTSRRSPKRRRRAGLEVAGYTTQAHFLIGCGLADFGCRRRRARPGRSGSTCRDRRCCSRLPGEMGERFKVIALARDYDAPLRGFAVRDLRHTL